VDVTDPIRFTVLGNPRTQGSKTAFVTRRGKVALVEGRRPESRRAFADWRAALADEARSWQETSGAPGLIEGPVAVVLRFSLTRPASHPKRRRTWPTGARSGDVDKLTRAVGDALTGTLIRDDAQVVGLAVVKEWGDPPGVEVEVRPLCDGCGGLSADVFQVRRPSCPTHGALLALDASGGEA
jgi:crossover junction endodeoxyribonuclease RusA